MPHTEALKNYEAFVRNVSAFLTFASSMARNTRASIEESHRLLDPKRTTGSVADHEDRLKIFERPKE